MDANDPLEKTCEVAKPGLACCCRSLRCVLWACVYIHVASGIAWLITYLVYSGTCNNTCGHGVQWTPRSTVHLVETESFAHNGVCDTVSGFRLTDHQRKHCDRLWSIGEDCIGGNHVRGAYNMTLHHLCHHGWEETCHWNCADGTDCDDCGSAEQLPIGYRIDYWFLIFMPLTMILYYVHQPGRQLACLRAAAPTTALASMSGVVAWWALGCQWSMQDWQRIAETPVGIPTFLWSLAVAAAVSGGWTRRRGADVSNAMVAMVGTLMGMGTTHVPGTNPGDLTVTVSLVGVLLAATIFDARPASWSMVSGLSMLSLLALALRLAFRVHEGRNQFTDHLTAGPNKISIVMIVLAFMVQLPAAHEHSHWRRGEVAQSGDGVECFSVLCLVLTAVAALIVLIVSGTEFQDHLLMIGSTVAIFLRHMFLLREEDEERESNDARLNDPLLQTSSRHLCSAEVEQDRPALTVVLVDTRKFIRRAIQMNKDEGCCQSLSTLKRDGKVLAKTAGLAMGAWRVQHAMVVATSSYSLVVLMVNLQYGHLTRSFQTMPLSPHSACITACVLSAGLIVISSSSLLKDMGFNALPIQDKSFRITTTCKALLIACKLIINLEQQLISGITSYRNHQKNHQKNQSLMHALLVSSTALSLMVSMAITWVDIGKPDVVATIEEKEPEVTNIKRLLRLYKAQWACTKIGLLVQLAAVTSDANSFLPGHNINNSFRWLTSGAENWITVNVGLCLVLALGSLITNELARLIEPKTRHSAAGSADGVRTTASFVALIAAPCFCVPFVFLRFCVSALITGHVVTIERMLRPWAFVIGGFAASGVCLCSLLLLKGLTRSSPLLKQSI